MRLYGANIPAESVKSEHAVRERLSVDHGFRGEPCASRKIREEKPRNYPEVIQLLQVFYGEKIYRSDHDRQRYADYAFHQYREPHGKKSQVIAWRDIVFQPVQ